jgi:hypothetical protein
MRYRRLEHRFLTNIPRATEPGILYVSIEYATAVHRCCCGCGEEVVTPLTPTDWKLIFDGETVSLWPSVGNWSYACKSHYVIEKNQVIGALPWSDRRILTARTWDRQAKANFYGTAQADPGNNPELPESTDKSSSFE